MAGGTGGEGSARRTALDLLARREHSLAELRDKLAAREFARASREKNLRRRKRSAVRRNLFPGNRLQRRFGQAPRRKLDQAKVFSARP